MNFLSVLKKDLGLTISVVFLITASVLTLTSIAPFLFPQYYIYLIAGIVVFILFANLDFEIYRSFSVLLYVFSLVLLVLPLILGEVTRGTVRWIPLGPITLQPAEIVRPWLLLFLAQFAIGEKLSLKRFIRLAPLLVLPLVMILIQPSLGVTILTTIGFAGVLMAAGVGKKNLLVAGLVFVLLAPLSWFVMEDYQKSRVLNLFTPTSDPSGAGYNSIQSMISVGSGMLSGRGLGEGVQTQLSFLPERHTDFIFASVAEELGFFGAFLLIAVSFFLLYRVISIAENAKNPVARAFVSGVFLSLFAQAVVHIGMNMGLLPITGITLPLVSAGGSSLLAVMISLGMVVSAKR